MADPTAGGGTEGLRALRDELMAYASQLRRMETQAGLAGPDTSVRVKDPDFLAGLLVRAASALEARKVASLTAERDRLRAALDEAEACLSIVEPRTDRAEYLRTLETVRTALKLPEAPDAL